MSLPNEFYILGEHRTKLNSSLSNLANLGSARLISNPTPIAQIMSKKMKLLSHITLQFKQLGNESGERYEEERTCASIEKICIEAQIN